MRIGLKSSNLISTFFGTDMNSQRRALAYLNQFLTRVIYSTIDINDTILEQEIIHSNQFERKNIEAVNYAR